MLYGSQYATKTNARLYIKTYTTAFTKPATAAAAITALDGVAAVNTFTVDAVSAGDYIVVSSNTNAYCIWIADDGDLVTNKPTAPSTCTAYLAATVATASLSDVDVIGAAIATAINTTYDLSAVYTASTDTLVVTSAQGGTEITAADATSGQTTAGSWAVVNTTPGAGDWTIIGAIADDYSVEVDATEIEDAEGNDITTNEKVTAEFKFLNINERNIDILKPFKGTKVSMVIADETDSSYPELYCINDLLFNVSITPAGDTKNAPIKMSKRVRNTLTGTEFWSYDTDLV